MHGAPAWVTVTVCPATVIVALRDAVAVFAVALTLTVPLPDPLAPLVTVSHDALLVAVQVQPVAAVTVTAPLPPPDTMLKAVADSVNVQGTPAWVTVTLCPATVTVALCDNELVFAVAVMVTVPFPDPLAPLVTVNHAALLVAVHAHPVGAVTVAEPLPPPATMFKLVGETVNVQVTPGCVIVTVWPAMVSVALRDVDDVLAVAE